jgi:hypothetical protein
VHAATVPGFAFIASIIAIFSGAQLFALGIIGEYLARMHLRSMERPTYLVSDATEPATSSSSDERVLPKAEPRAVASAVHEPRA